MYLIHSHVVHGIIFQWGATENLLFCIFMLDQKCTIESKDDIIRQEPKHLKMTYSHTASNFNFIRGKETFSQLVNGIWFLFCVEV